jgi:hypothetical protein
MVRGDLCRSARLGLQELHRSILNLRRTLSRHCRAP